MGDDPVYTTFVYLDVFSSELRWFVAWLRVGLDVPLLDHSAEDRKMQRSVLVLASLAMLTVLPCRPSYRRRYACQ